MRQKRKSGNAARHGARKLQQGVTEAGVGAGCRAAAGGTEKKRPSKPQTFHIAPEFVRAALPYPRKCERIGCSLAASLDHTCTGCEAMYCCRDHLVDAMLYHSAACGHERSARVTMKLSASAPSDERFELLEAAQLSMCAAIDKGTAELEARRAATATFRRKTVTDAIATAADVPHVAGEPLLATFTPSLLLQVIRLDDECAACGLVSPLPLHVRCKVCDCVFCNEECMGGEAHSCWRGIESITVEKAAIEHVLSTQVEASCQGNGERGVHVDATFHRSGICKSLTAIADTVTRTLTTLVLRSYNDGVCNGDKRCSVHAARTATSALVVCLESLRMLDMLAVAMYVYPWLLAVLWHMAGRDTKFVCFLEREDRVVMAALVAASSGCDEDLNSIAAAVDKWAYKAALAFGENDSDTSGASVSFTSMVDGRPKGATSSGALNGVEQFFLEEIRSTPGQPVLETRVEGGQRRAYLNDKLLFTITESKVPTGGVCQVAGVPAEKLGVTAMMMTEGMDGLDDLVMFDDGGDTAPKGVGSDLWTVVQQLCAETDTAFYGRVDPAAVVSLAEVMQARDAVRAKVLASSPHSRPVFATDVECTVARMTHCTMLSRRTMLLCK